MMKKIRVMLSSRPKLLSEVLRNMISHQPDMEVVGEVLDPLQLLHASKQTAVDAVIITPLNANGEPKICRQLLIEHPHLKIVALSANGEAAYLYQSGSARQRIGEPSEQSVLTAIREALLPDTDEST